MIKLSIVVPVYNVEQFIDECIKSILTQIGDECEVILVDDGSTDSSKFKCDKYANNNNIIVIHQENQGLSGARNKGIMRAKGEYIAFVDSDDRIATGAIDKILSEIKSEPSDIFFMRGIKFYEDRNNEPLGDSISKMGLYGKGRKDAIKYLTSRPKYPGSACTKIYRKEFLIDNNIWFPSDRRHSEDLGFILDVILAAETFNAVDYPYYEYRQNRINSISSKKTKKSFWDLALFIDESITKLNNTEYKEICDDCLSFVAYEFLILLWHYIALEGNDRNRGRQFIKTNCWVLKYSKRRIIRMFYYLIVVLGVRITTSLIDVYMKKR